MMAPVALVTGAAGGIGAAVVRRLASAGYRVAAADLLEAPTPAAEQLDDANSRRVVAVPLDVTEPASVTAAVAAAADLGPLHAVVHVAGVLGAADLGDQDDALVDRVLGVNLAGAMRVSRAAAGQLSAGGSIVSISSIAAVRGGARGVSAYAASKAGLEGFTRALACELARNGVRCNAVAPGFVRAPMLATMAAGGTDRLLAQVPLRRLAEPEDIADAVEFLVSDRASYVTGVVLPVDGGVLAR